MPQMSFEDAKLIIEAAGKKAVEMTPEDKARRRERRQMRRALVTGKPVKAGTWALVLGACRPDPEFFEKRSPVGLSKDAVDGALTNGARHQVSKSVVIGLYPDRKSAIKAAEKLVDMLIADIDKEYHYLIDRYQGKEQYCRAVLDELEWISKNAFTIVNIDESNKKWSNQRWSPFDRGYSYSTDHEAREEAAKATEPLIQKYRKELERLERGEDDRGSRISSWDPYSGNFRNVYAHH